MESLIYMKLYLCNGHYSITKAHSLLLFSLKYSSCLFYQQPDGLAFLVDKTPKGASQQKRLQELVSVLVLFRFLNHLGCYKKLTLINAAF